MEQFGAKGIKDVKIRPNYSPELLIEYLTRISHICLSRMYMFQNPQDLSYFEEYFVGGVMRIDFDKLIWINDDEYNRMIYLEEVELFSLRNADFNQLRRELTEINDTIDYWVDTDLSSRTYQTSCLSKLKLIISLIKINLVPLDDDY